MSMLKLKRNTLKRIFRPNNSTAMQNSELSCVVCGNEFSSFGQLKIHKKIHVSQQGLKCGLCNRIYLSKKLFVKHLQSHEKPRFFNCLECNKTFPNKTRLRTHSRSHTGERPFKCSHCNSYFGSKYQVKLHERRHTGEKPHGCAVCKKSFSATSGLAQHMKIHTTDSPFSCNVCNKSFKHKEKLENHSRIHTGVKPYMCDQCPLVFRLKHALVRHLRIHSGHTFKCSLCPKQFGEIYALKKHHRNKHTNNDFPGPAISEDIKGCYTEKGLKNSRIKSRTKPGREFPNKKRKKIKSTASHLGKFVSDKCFLTIRERNASGLVEENGWHLIPLPESNKSFNGNVADKISNKEHCENEAVHQIGLQRTQQSESRECCTKQEMKNLMLCENEEKIQGMISFDRKTCILRHERTDVSPSLLRTKSVSVNKDLAQTSTIEYLRDKGNISVDDCHAKSDQIFEINSNTAHTSHHMQSNQIVFEKDVTRNRFHQTDHFTSVVDNMVTHPAHNTVRYSRESNPSEKNGHFARLCNNEARYDGNSVTGLYYKLRPDVPQYQPTTSAPQSDQLNVPKNDSHYNLTAAALASSHQSSKGHDSELEGTSDGYGENRIMPNSINPLDQSNLTIYSQLTRHNSGMTGSQRRSAETSMGDNQKHLSGIKLHQGRFEDPQEISFHGGSNVVHHMPKPSLLELDDEDDTELIKWSTCDYNGHLLPDPKHHYQDMYRAGKSKCPLPCSVTEETAAHVDTENLKTHSDTFGKTQHHVDKDTLKLTPDHNHMTSVGVGLEKMSHPKNKTETNFPEVTSKSENPPNLCERDYTSGTQRSNHSKNFVSACYQHSSVAPTNDFNMSSISFKKTDQKSALPVGITSAVIGSYLNYQSKQMDRTAGTCHYNLNNAMLLGQCPGNISRRGNIQTRGSSPVIGVSSESSECNVEEKSQHCMNEGADNTLTLQNCMSLSDNSTLSEEENYKIDCPSPSLESDHRPVKHHERYGRPGQGLQDVTAQDGLGNEGLVMRHENFSVTVQQSKGFKFESNSPANEDITRKNKKNEIVGEYGETKKIKDILFQGEAGVVATMKKLRGFVKVRETKTSTRATKGSKKWKFKDMLKKECHRKADKFPADKPNLETTVTKITNPNDRDQSEANRTLDREPANTPKIRAKFAEPEQDLSLDDLNKVEEVKPTNPESNRNNKKHGSINSEVSPSLLDDQSQQGAGSLLPKTRKSHQNGVRVEFVNANCIIDFDLDLRRCRLCGNEYKNIGCLRKHIFTSHFKGVGHECKICNKHFPHKSRLDRHLKTHAGKKPFPCSLCEQGFTAQKHLDNHMNRHIRVPSVFVCDECGKTFPRRYQLKVHQRTHSGEKPYKCSHCQACFATSFQVHLHERVHTGERPYQCRYCGKCFRGNANLSLHVKSHTDDRPYLCATCGASFREVGKLNAHIRIHTGARPFMCDQCPKVFKVKHLLVKHMRWHSGDVFKCDYCDKSFDEKWVRKKHVAKQHPNMQMFN